MHPSAAARMIGAMEPSKKKLVRITRTALKALNSELLAGAVPLAEARKQNNRDSEEYFKELLAAAQKQGG